MGSRTRLPHKGQSRRTTRIADASSTPNDSQPTEPDTDDRRRAPRRKADLQVTAGNRELETTLLISRALAKHSTLEGLIQETLETALRSVNAASGSILLADPTAQHLITYRSVGEKPLPPGFAKNWHDGIAGAVFRSAQHAIIVDGAKSDVPRVDKTTGSVIKNMIILPLKRWQGEPIGVLEILNKRDGHFDDCDVAVLTVISSLATPAIEEARFFEAKKLAEVAQLAGDMSHDIKNLLMPVLCGAGVLKDELDELLAKLSLQNETQAQQSRTLCHEVLTMIQEDVLRISDRVREMSDCVKGMSAPPNFSLCQVSNIVQSVFKTLDLMAKKNGVTLKSEGLEDLPAIEADEQRLYNAFYNLVNNAIPEVPPGGAVIISGTAPRAAEVLDIRVTDTGRGMPAEIRDSLFTARAISRKPGGTGLGTKIVKDVIDAHRGHIGVESTEGKGTVFRFILPVTQAGEPCLSGTEVKSDLESMPIPDVSQLRSA